MDNLKKRLQSYSNVEILELKKILLGYDDKNEEWENLINNLQQLFFSHTLFKVEKSFFLGS